MQIPYPVPSRYLLVSSLYRNWITLYLISMTGLFWTAYVSSTGGPLSDSVFLATSVVGINLVVHILRYDRIQIPLPAFTGTGRARGAHPPSP